MNRATGSRIRGTLETLSGVALAERWGRTKDGLLSFEWAGETDVWWDEQKTVRIDGERVFVDEDGEEVLEHEVELRQEEEDA